MNKVVKNAENSNEEKTVGRNEQSILKRMREKERNATHGNNAIDIFTRKEI